MIDLTTSVTLGGVRVDRTHVPVNEAGVQSAQVVAYFRQWVTRANGTRV
jgi:hypothetical protein